MKMPNWTREELILALQLYCKYDLNWLNKASEDNSEIIELSNILRNLPIHSKAYKETANFRSPSSVHMKLMNFLRYDDQRGKKGLRVGLQNGSKLEQEIWNELAKNATKIDEYAELIINKYSSQSNKSSLVNETILEDDLDIKEVLVPMIDQITSKIEDIKNHYISRRKEAAFMESLDESQNIINEMYKGIMQLNEWNEQINALKREINEWDLPKNNQKIKEKVEESNAIKIGRLVKINLTELILTEKLSSQDIEDMLDEAWSKEILHIGYPFIKVYDRNISMSEQQKIDGYYRYWGQVFSYRGENYLVCKEWYESNRKYFLKWMNKFELKNTMLLENQHTVSTKPIYTFTTPLQVQVLGKKYQVKNWANVLVTVCEIMIELKPNLVEQFDKNSLFVGKSRVYFSYNKDQLTRSAKRLSNALWVETNFSSQDIAILCKEIINECGYNDADIDFIVKTKDQIKQQTDKVKSIDNSIKFSSKYNSITLDKDLLIFILSSIKEIDEEKVFIESKEIFKKVEDKIQMESTYKNSKYIVNNIIKFLIDKGVLLPFQDAKRGKYVIEDYEIMHNLIMKPEIIAEL